MLPIEFNEQLLRVPLEEFGGAFGGCREAFRFEALPKYVVEEEAIAFRNFVEKGVCEPADFNHEWNDLLADAHARGARFRRVRLLSSPLSNYEEFEIRCGYHTSQRLGEEIRTARGAIVEETSDAVPILKDFWLFDSDVVYLMDYDTRGIFLGISRVPQRYTGIYSNFASILWEKSETLDL